MTTTAGSAKLSEITRKLSELSVKNYYSPYDKIEFPEKLDRDAWFTTPELISIYGTPEYEKLSENDRKKLSFLEALNFFSINIHGEKSLMEGLAHRLYENPNQDTSRYLHHFLDEENKHMVYFGGFCARYGGKVYPDRKFTFPREYAPGEEDFLFFAKVFVFEEIVDFYNIRMSKDDRLHPLARAINLNHHEDEMRHLAFGRILIQDLFQEFSPAWGNEKVAAIREYLENYIVATWKEYYNPDVYKDAGLADPYGLAERAFDAPAAQNHRANVIRSCRAHLVRCGILEAP